MRTSRFIMTFALLSISTACGDELTGVGADVVLSEPFSFQGDAGGVTRLYVTNINGQIDVVGTSDDDTYQVTGVRRVENCSRATAEARLDGLEVHVFRSGSSLLVDADYPQQLTPCNLGVDFEITVPEGLSADITHVNGAITLVHIDDGVSVVGVNGEVILQDIEDGAFVRLVNGAIDADVEIDGDETIDVLTVNGSIDLTIPTDTDAQLTATQVNGTIVVTNLTLTDQVVTQSTFTGTLGSGQGAILLQTTNGMITVTGR